MTTFRRGTLSASGVNNGTELDTVSTTSDPDTSDPLFATQTWTLDHLGNWSSVVNDGTTQTRTHNSQNQVTSITGLTTPTFDNNGSMTKDQSGVQFTYDAWDRQKQVKNSSGTLLKTHSYDANGRRIIEERTAAGGGVEYRTLYYTSKWQVAEERISATPGTEGPARIQYVWSIQYVDEMVLRDRDADSNGSLEERLYVVQDAQFNVTATINTSATVQERILYDANGSVKFFDSAYGSASTTGTKAWVYLHQGARYDQNSLLYHFRNREHHPYLGRWMQRDPDGYHSSLSLYQSLSSSPARFLDPYGLRSQDPQQDEKKQAENSVKTQMNLVHKDIASLCEKDKECLKPCDCTKEHCLADAALIAKTYVNLFNELQKPYEDAKHAAESDRHYGWLCYEWAILIEQGLDSIRKDLHCFKITRVGWGEIKQNTVSFDHNFVVISLGDVKTDKGPKKDCSRILDPWTKRGPHVYPGEGAPEKYPWLSWNYVYDGSKEAGQVDMWDASKNTWNNYNQKFEAPKPESRSHKGAKWEKGSKAGQPYEPPPQIQDWTPEK
jgi:RHS repeat-associated protein